MNEIRCKLVTSLEKVFPAKEPSGEAMTQVLTALQGETISFQFAYRWNFDYKGSAKVEITSPIADKIQVRTVELVPCEYPCHWNHDDNYLVTEPGLYPDRLALIPKNQIVLIPMQWRSLWIDVDTEGLAAGLYPVKISLKNGDVTYGSAEVTYEVLDASLPPLSIPHTEWFHTDCLANYYNVEVFSEEHWRIIENFIRTAVKRSCNMILTPVFTPPLDTAVGGERRTVQLVGVKVEEDGYSFDFSKFERWVSICKKCGMKYIEISHLFSQWGANAAPKIMGEKDGKECKLFGWETNASSEEYKTFLQQFLRALKVELKRLEIEDVTWFHVSDEPAMWQIDTYRAAKNIVAEELEGYCMFDALSDYAFYETGLIPQPVCAIDHIQPFLENRPEKLLTYYCTAQGNDVTNRFISMPGTRTRILGTQLYKYNLDGFLHWGYNFYNAQFSVAPIDPYRCTDADRAFPSGDAFLVYPGKDGVPEESLRIMLMGETMADFRAMKYLEQLTDRETVLACIEPEGSTKVELKQYPRTITEMVAIRSRVNEKIREVLSKGQLLKAGSIPVMAKNVTKEQPFHSGTGDSQYFRIPALITLSDGTLVAAADARYETTEDGGGLDTIGAISTDGGKTWCYNFPIYFPDSKGYASTLATTVIDPVLVKGADGTIYCLADVNPTGVTTYYLYKFPGQGTGYIKVDGVDRLPLTSNYDNVNIQPVEDDIATYEYYVGDFNENGYAPVVKRVDNMVTEYAVDEWYNLYTVKDGAYVADLTQKQVNTDTMIQQNAFYKDSILHVYNTGYMWMVSSKDNGRTWGNPVILNPQIKRDEETGLLVSPGKGTLTKTGDILLPFYNHQNGKEFSSFIYSSDNAKTWKRTNEVLNMASSESELVELKDGTIRMFYRNFTGKICYADAVKNEAGEYVFGRGKATEISVESTCNVTALAYSRSLNEKQVIIVGCPAGPERKNGKLFVFTVEEGNELALIDTYEVPNSLEGYCYSCIDELPDGSIALLWEPSHSAIEYRVCILECLKETI